MYQIPLGGVGLSPSTLLSWKSGRRQWVLGMFPALPCRLEKIHIIGNQNKTTNTLSITFGASFSVIWSSRVSIFGLSDILDKSKLLR